MPPEAFEGRADARGDIYCLGLTLYELLALRPAFDETDRHRLIKQVTHGGARRGCGSCNPEVPRDLETIVHKAIDATPASATRRPASWPTTCSGSWRTADPGPADRHSASGSGGGAGGNPSAETHRRNTSH